MFAASSARWLASHESPGFAFSAVECAFDHRLECAFDRCFERAGCFFHVTLPACVVGRDDAAGPYSQPTPANHSAETIYSALYSKLPLEAERRGGLLTRRPRVFGRPNKQPQLCDL
jgi:hypothetical protein